MSETPIETPVKPPSGVFVKPVSNLTVKHFRRKTKKAQDSLKKDHPAHDFIFSFSPPITGNRYVSTIAKIKAEELHCIKIVLPLWQSTLILIQLKPFAVKPLHYICTRFALYLHYICTRFAPHLRYICTNRISLPGFFVRLVCFCSSSPHDFYSSIALCGSKYD